MGPHDDKRRPAALNLAPTRSASTDSSSSYSSLKAPRTPRFAEATSVHSPVEGTRSPFDDPPARSEVPRSQPGDIGFGYISNNDNRESVAVPMTPRSPLKSAMRVPGTPARRIENPLSPTFREEDILEKREAATDKEQVRDLKIKTRVRMAKFALRGVNFSCSLIIISMIAATLQIFNATRKLPAQSGLPPWAEGTARWPQILVLTMASISLLVCIGVMLSYCRGGHKRAEKVATYYTLFAIGWFILSMILWAVAAGIFQSSRNNGGGKDMWGWSCKENKRSEVFSEKVDYALLCRLQNWALICMVIEIVIDVICVLLYSIVFYRYYTKRRLHKSMDMRDRARSDLYLAQLRTQSAPNTPGLKSPGLYSQYTMSPRHPEKTFENLSRIEEASPFTPGTRFVEPESSFAKPQPTFKLQAPPVKAPSATPKSNANGITPTSATGPAPNFPPVQQQQQQQPPQEHAPMAADEPVYEAVPIPGAYADAPVKSPPPNQYSFEAPGRHQGTAPGTHREFLGLRKRPSAKPALIQPKRDELRKADKAAEQGEEESEAEEPLGSFFPRTAFPIGGFSPSSGFVSAPQSTIAGLGPIESSRRAVDMYLSTMVSEGPASQLLRTMLDAYEQAAWAGGSFGLSVSRSFRIISGSLVAGYGPGGWTFSWRFGGFVPIDTIGLVGLMP